MAVSRIINAKFVVDHKELTDGIVLTKRELREAKKVVEEMQPPLQRYRDESGKLGTFLRAGAIDSTTHSAAMAKLRAEYVGSIPGLSQFAGLLTPQGAIIAATTASVAALTGAVAGLSTITLTGIERLDSMADSAAALGMESRQFQRLRAAATLADAPVDKLDSMIRKVMVSVAEATDESSSLGKQFRELGLDANALVAASPEEMLSAIGSAISKLPTSAEQLKAINDIAGKGNYQFRQLLLNFTDFASKAERFTLQKDAFGNIDAADMAMKEVGLQFEHITDIVAVSFAPVVTEISEQLSAMATDGRLDQMASGMETVAGWSVKIASGLANAVQHVENLHHLLSLGGMAQDINEMILGPEEASPQAVAAERERAKRDIAASIERRKQQAAKNQWLIEEEGAAATKADEKRLKEAELAFREFEAMFGRGTADDARLLGEEVKRLPTEFEKASQARREFMRGLEADAMAAGRNERQLVEFKAQQLGLSDAEVNRALKLFDRAQAGRRSLEDTPSGVSPAVKGSQEAAAAIARWRTNQDKQLDALEQIEHNTRERGAIIIEPVEIR